MIARRVTEPGLPSADEIRQRVRRLQELLAAHDFDAAWIAQPANLYYLARTAQQGLMVIPREGDPRVLIRKSIDRAQDESPFPVDELPGYRHWPELMSRLNLPVERIGLELDVVPAAEYLRFGREFPQTRFGDITDLVRQIRLIKSEYEISCLEAAGRRLQYALEAMTGVIRAGMSEREIGAELDAELRRQGDPGLVRVRNWRAEITRAVVSAGASAAYPVAFDGPVGYVGAHPALPFGPSERILERGMPLMVDVVASAGGYFVDCTRVFSAGELPSRLVDAHAFIIELMTALESRLCAGAIPADLYGYAVEAARKAGYEEAFMNRGRSKVRFIGHGVGLELDEWPVVFDKWREPLQPGMAIALEPKLIFPDGGVGLENTYVVRHAGPPRRMPEFPPDIISVP